MEKWEIESMEEDEDDFSKIGERAVRLVKRRPSIGVLLLAFIFIVIFVFAAYTHHQAGTLGQAVGNPSGKVVGTAVGSARGITDGVSQGAAAGEAAGLSAEDTTADIQETMESLGTLEVLIAGVTLKNVNQIGEAYEGLYVIDGDAVFTVDLGQAEIRGSDDGSDIYITIPEPTLEVYLDQSSTRKLAEIQNFSLTVTAEDGLTAYLNSMTNTVEKVKESMTNYDSLMENAEVSAIARVEQLASAVCAGDQEIHVEFQ
ncbi:MAG: DUF4230 domain-containing protein [Lachnospiraceae bacterium]|nr:DUF4230 domain-containing protein [Lachnospiraceae bacterium]